MHSFSCLKVVLWFLALLLVFVSSDGFADFMKATQGDTVEYQHWFNQMVASHEC